MSGTVLAMALRAEDWWIMATAACCCVACGVPGCFLVLRRMSLVGDAISHAVLPGLAVAFIVTSSREVGPMLVGALAVGLLTTVLTAAIARWGKVPEDAALGVVFTTFFAVGVVLVTWVAGQIDLDPGCVLYGLIEFTPFDTVVLAGQELPRSFVWLATAALLNCALIAVFYKELKIVSFDPYLATTMGISAGVVHYALMTMVAATTVVSFEAVGSILVVAMLIAPGATAQLLTDRLGRMLWIAAGVGVVAAVVGYLLALYWNTSVAGMVSVVAGGEFALAVLLAPRYGVASRLVHKTALAVRIFREDVLGMLYRVHEAAASGRAVRPVHTGDIARAVGGGLVSRLALGSLHRRGDVRMAPGGGLALTEPGLARARQVVRSHRLWESYLSTHLGLPLDHLHEPSHRVEHFITPEMQAELIAQAEPATDPHGKPIPPGAI